MQYIIGACAALLAQSTWNSSDENAVAGAINRAQALIGGLATLEACPMIEFRLNPDDPHYWDYSTDGGTTWTRQPDCPSNFTPEYIADGGVASGWRETVNGDLSNAPMPVPATATTADDAIITDPASLLRNLISLATGGIDGLALDYLSSIGLTLLKQNGVNLDLIKIAGFGSGSAPVVNIAGAATYDYALIEVPD